MCFYSPHEDVNIYVSGFFYVSVVFDKQTLETSSPEFVVKTNQDELVEAMSVSVLDVYQQAGSLDEV